MRLELEGQLSLFDVPEDQYGWCPMCHMCWKIMPRPAEWQARHDAEHAPQDDGRCQHMHNVGTTEPYFTVAEINTQVFADGGKIQYPRPYGFGGLYALPSQGPNNGSM